MEPGSKLAHYEILSPLGKGGMGEVWKAKDTKLGREVAIKTLPEEFAQDADRLARFEREAKLLASLNHPNIASIYGLDENEGKRFLVLELVEGPTLEDRIKQGAIPVEESLKLALQIADALKAAHDSGVIHRDLKPSNIKITDDDKVKVLDFGLAKALEGDTGEANLSQSPTLSMAATQAGVILGTAAYMSPEQAKGRAVDKRADIFAFGCVLYEMLTGRQSFGKSDVTESLSAVISLQPEWNSLPTNLNPRLRETVERCLEKPVARRYQDIGDVKLEIEAVLAVPGGGLAQPAPENAVANPMGRRQWSAVTILGIVLSGAVVWFLRSPVVQSPTWLPLHIELAVGDIRQPSFALSPDGRRLVYAGPGQLYLRDFGQDFAQAIPGTEEGLAPFFSPDGQWLGFGRAGTGGLFKVALAGGLPSPIATGAVRGASWGDDDTIVFGSATGGLSSVSADAGEPSPLTTLDQGQIAHIWPEILPGGNFALFTIWTGSLGTSQIAVVDLETGEYQALVGGVRPSYASTGHIVFAREASIWAAAFDASQTIVGDPLPIVDGATVRPGWGVAEFAMGGGSLVYDSGSGAVSLERSLVWVDSSGSEDDINAELRNYVYPRISPDGGRIAIDVRDQNTDIQVWNIAGQNLAQITVSQFTEGYPAWTSDGARIAFESMQTGATRVFWRRADGTGNVDPILPLELFEEFAGMNPYFFSSEDALVFREQANPVTGDNIGMISLKGTSEITWLLRNDFDERNAELSRDERWMAYESNESGSYEISVTDFPGANGRWLVSNDGGVQPLWSPFSNELFYVEPGSPPYLMSVSYDTEPEFSIRNRVRLMEWPYAPFPNSPPGRAYDIADDGRFLAIKPGVDQINADAGSSHLNIVLNWTQELLERVPVP